MHFQATACPGPIKNTGDESRLFARRSAAKAGCLKFESGQRDTLGVVPANAGTQPLAAKRKSWITRLRG
jgi:hypothetical protein